MGLRNYLRRRDILHKIFMSESGEHFADIWMPSELIPWWRWWQRETTVTIVVTAKGTDGIIDSVLDDAVMD